MKIVNLTPHAITIVVDGVETTYASEGVARVSTLSGKLLEGSSFLYSSTSFGAVEGVPSPQPDTIYVVSAIVAGRCTGRTDVFSPGTGPNDGAIRDEKGQIKAVTRLIQAPLV